MTDPSGGLSDADQDKVVKVMFVGSPPVLQRLQATLLSALSGLVTAFFTYPEYLEVMAIGTSKRTACEALLALAGRSWQDTLVIGDGLNDLPMMEPAAIRVAVANAHADVRAVANFVAPGHDDDGAAIALSAFCLEEPSAIVAMMSK